MWIEDLLNFTFADEHWNHNGVWKRKKERKKERKKKRKKEIVIQLLSLKKIVPV
jgi:hypothetical protein